VTKDKKRGFMSSLLKRKNSMSPALKDGEFSETVSGIDDLYFNESVYFDGSGDGAVSASFENIPLPAKLQARGDSADPLPIHISSRSGKVIKRSKKPALPAPLTSRPGPTPSPSHTSVYTGDPEISLDTNLDSMEGIVNMDVISNSPRHSSFSSSVFSSSETPLAIESRPSISLTQSPPTGNFNLDPSSPAPHRRRPSIPLSLLRKSSLDPAGGLAFPLLTEAISYRNRQASVASGSSPTSIATPAASSSSDIITPLPRSSSIDAIKSYDTANATAERNLSNASSYDRFLGSSTIDRRPSTMTLGSIATSAGLASLSKDGSAAWTAPDSWAVRGGAAVEHESSSEDDDVGDEEEDIDETVESLASQEDDNATPETDQELEVIGTSLTPRSRGNSAGVKSGNALMHSARPSISVGRPSTKNGRPGTAETRLTGKNVSLSHYVIDFRSSLLITYVTVYATSLSN
jgi:hypothetical protein